MWNISVAPMPSMISMPVASFQSARVAAGSASPAATHLRSGRRRARRCFFSRAPAAIARYEVGAVKQTVARWATIASSRSGGPAFSSSTVEAPMCIGNSVRPPSPKVKASGGLPMKTSSGVGAQHVRREADAARHHVAVEVHRRLRLAGGAGGEGEQAGVVGGGVDVGERRVVARHARLEAVGGRGVAEADDAREHAAITGRGSVELAAQRHVAERDRRPAPSRRSGRAPWRAASASCATAMPPAFITANQQATSIGLLAARSSTRLPGTRPQSFDEHVGDAVGLALQLGVGPAGPPGALTQGRSPRPSSTWRSSSSVAQFSRSGNCSSGRSKQELGLRLGRRQVVAREGVDVGGVRHGALVPAVRAGFRTRRCR